MTRILKAFLIAAPLVLFMPVSQAQSTIKVDVVSTSKDVKALGFTVGGKDHGGMGKSYSKKGLPAGAVYQFGIRIGSVFGDSVACGSRKLSSSSRVTLKYNGKSCSITVKAQP